MIDEAFCREHGIFHLVELRDPDCAFEDGFGEALEAAGRLIPEGVEVPEVVQAVNSRSDEFVRDQIRSRRGMGND